MNSDSLFRKITLAAVWRTDWRDNVCSGPGERCCGPRWDANDRGGKKSRIQDAVLRVRPIGLDVGYKREESRMTAHPDRYRCLYCSEGH